VPTAAPVPTPAPTPTPAPSIWQTLGGNYAYDTPCTGTTGDPIGTILLVAGPDAATASQLAFDRLSDIAMTSGYEPIITDRSDFRDNGGCVEGAITRGTNDGFHPSLSCLPYPYCVDPRWHTRCIVHAQPSPFGYWASCTPHWDWPACPKHEVPPVYNGPENYSGSGYDAARDWLHYQLVTELGMVDAGQVFFDHSVGTQQCTAEFTFETNKVNVIALPCCSLHLDMDPTTPGVQSLLNVNGPQDISVDIVLGDTVRDLSALNFSLIYDDTRLTPAGVNNGGLDGNPDFGDGLGIYWNCGLGGSSPDIDAATGPGHGVAFLSCYTTATGNDIDPATVIGTLHLHVAASGTSAITIGDASFAHYDLTNIGTCDPGGGGTMTCLGGSVTAP
jgi:hypothetical protein